MFEILFPYNGKEYTMIFRKIIHSDGITMYFGNLRSDDAAFLNCIQIDNQPAFVTLSENVCPAMENAILKCMQVSNANKDIPTLSTPVLFNP